MKRYVPIGTYVAVQMFTNMMIAWTVPKSRLYDLVHQGGLPAQAGSIVLAALCLYGLLDIILTEALCWKRAKPRAPGLACMLTTIRPWAWVALAIAHASQMFVAQRIGMNWLVSQVFVWAAIGCAWTAWLALRGDYKAKMAACRAS